MKTLGSTTKLIISIIAIVIIGYFDWITGYEFSFSIVYLIPIALLSLDRRVTIFQLVINSIAAAVAWFYADKFTNHLYSKIFFLYWEAFMRFSIYLIVSLLIYNLRKNQEKLQEANKNLRALNEEKNTFLGMAAHDLRNHITSILGFSDLLLNYGETKGIDENRNMVKHINDAGKKSIALLTNLLDTSRIEAGIIKVNFKVLNYLEYVKESIRLNQFMADKKGIYLLLETEVDDLFVWIDPVYFEEVLNNLISNAIKYSYPKSKVTIKVSNAQQRVLTEIIDSGVGISECEVDRLFQPFQRSSAKPTAGETSVGLGLAIVKKMVLLHNGEVGIKSVLNKGTNVFFYLPKATERKLEAKQEDCI